MSNPIIIETDLKDILAKLDNRLERIETKLEVLPKIETEVSQLKEDVKDLKERETAQIWALIVTVIGATVAAIIKFGFLTKT
jgi:prefoldin subunit 5